MKLDPIYQHKDLYIQKMNDFVNGKIVGIDFSMWFLSQRIHDLEEWDLLLSTEESQMLNRNRDKWMSGEITKEEYEDIASKIVWPIKNLFFDLFGELQAVDIEDFKEYFYAKKYGCEDKIQADRRVDEEEFRRRVKAKLDLLEQNKGKW